MGKPLIGDAQMLAIHETMLHLRSLEPPAARGASSRAAGPHVPASIAMLAATLLQLRPVDALLTQQEEPLADEVLALAQEATFSPLHRAASFHAGEQAAAIAAGHALAQARTSRPGDDAPVTVALLRGHSASLAAALQVASDTVMPLLLIVQGGEVARAMVMESVPNVEVVRIDADDAVACCRVMQESLLRTRNRWGSVVLQAITLPGAADPVLAFEAHLRRRNLLP